MISRPSFRTPRQRSRGSASFGGAARAALADVLPKGLYKRSLLIVILPMVLLQTAVTFAFMQHHWELVTRRLSEAVARDVGALTDLYQKLPPGEDDAFLSNLASERFRAGRDRSAASESGFPRRCRVRFFAALDPWTRTLPRRDQDQTGCVEPFWLDTIGRSGLMEIRVDLGDRMLRLVTRRALAYEANAHIFVLWMLAAMLVLLTVAIVFLQKIQISPHFLRLARAAEDFGKGRSLEFNPHGAREVRQAGHAFIEMEAPHRAGDRATHRHAQRRQPRPSNHPDPLQALAPWPCSTIPPTANFLQKDVDEMGQMLEGYLAFARGDTSRGPPPTLTDIAAMLEDVRAGAERHGAEIQALRRRGNLDIRVRPMAMKRCIGNLVANAQRHADHVEISGATRPAIRLDCRRRRQRGQYRPAHAGGSFPAVLPA